MKKIMAMVLSLIAVLSFVACDKNNSLNNSASNESSFNSSDNYNSESSESSFNSSDNYNSESSENSSNVDSSLPNEDPPVVIAPPEDENPYPNSVVPVEGVNRYEHLKLQAPAKTVSVVEYQNYGIEQIDVYLNAIAQDESIMHDTTYLCMELTKRKYAIYKQEDFDKIDLILIDAENLLKKYILEYNDAIAELMSVIPRHNISYYYGMYNDMYFVVLDLTLLAAVSITLNVGHCFFYYNHQTHEYLYAWKSGWDYPKMIKEAYEDGLVSNEQIAELFQKELYRYSDFKFYDYSDSISWEKDYVTASNFYSLQVKPSPYLINMHALESVKCESDRNNNEIEILASLSYKEFAKNLPNGVKNVEYGIENHNGEAIYSYCFSADKHEQKPGIFQASVTSIMHYYRDGSIKNTQYLATWYFKIEETRFLIAGDGWVRFYINLEYENGYKETHYGEKLYYTVNKNQYDAETQKYYNVYTFSEKFTPQEK